MHKIMNIDKVKRLRELRKSGISLKSLARYFDISTSQVSAIANGRSWSEQVSV